MFIFLGTFATLVYLNVFNDLNMLGLLGKIIFACSVTTDDIGKVNLIAQNHG